MSPLRGLIAIVLSWTLISTCGASSARLWLMTVIPSAFQATVLSWTSAWSELASVMAPPQAQPAPAQPFSQAALPLTVR